MNAVMISAAMSANKVATQNALNTAMMAAQHGSHKSDNSDAEYDGYYVFQVLVGTFLAILLGVSFFGVLCLLF